MCRLLGYKTKNPEATTDILIKALKDFHMLARKGCVPCGIKPGHEDGWGMAAYKEGALALHYRFPGSAITDKMFGSLISIIKSVQPDIVIGHLRKTSLGENIMPNIQPFVSDNISFCHNGTVMFPLKMIPKGLSDSLVFFRMLSGDSLKSFKPLYKRISKSYEYTAMNMLVSDGKTITAVRDWNERNIKAEKLGFENYYTLYVLEGANATFVCSEPLNSLHKFKVTPLRNKELKNF